MKEVAIEKVKREAESASGSNVPAIAIYNYVLKKCEEDSDFAAFVCDKSKTLSDCFNHVIQRFYEKGAFGGFTEIEENGQRVQGVGAESSEIFAVVDEYYSVSSEQLKAEREKRLEELKIQQEERRRMEEEKRNARAAEIKAKAKKAQDEKKEKEVIKKAREEAQEAQMSLF